MTVPRQNLGPSVPEIMKDFTVWGKVIQWPAKKEIMFKE